MLDDLISRPLQAVWLTAALTLVVAVAVFARRAARRPALTSLQRTARDRGAEDRARREAQPWWIG